MLKENIFKTPILKKCWYIVISKIQCRPIPVQYSMNSSKEKKQEMHLIISTSRKINQFKSWR